MKKLEFETSEGRFLLVDGVGEDFAMDMTHAVISEEWFINLSEITEEQASEIVDEPLFGKHYRDYTFIPTLDDSYAGEFRLNTAIESLHSLIKSKGYHLFKNPAPLLHHTRLEAEQKTFYNPYIFKLRTNLN